MRPRISVMFGESKVIVGHPTVYELKAVLSVCITIWEYFCTCAVVIYSVRHLPTLKVIAGFNQQLAMPARSEVLGLGRMNLPVK